MTKKDFVLIAHALRRSRPPFVDPHTMTGAGTFDDGRWEQWLTDRRVLIDMIALAHPRFDAARFRAATEA